MFRHTCVFPEMVILPIHFLSASKDTRVACTILSVLIGRMKANPSKSRVIAISRWAVWNGELPHSVLRGELLEIWQNGFNRSIHISMWGKSVGRTVVTIRWCKLSYLAEHWSGKGYLMSIGGLTIWRRGVMWTWSVWDSWDFRVEGCSRFMLRHSCTG